MKRVYLIRWIVAATMLLVVVLAIGLTDGLFVEEKHIGGGGGGGGVGGYVEKHRLFDDHNKFIATVQSNLNVPYKDTITYSVGEPEFEEVYGLETVYVMFSEGGEVVAYARCATSDGSLVSAILMYQAPEQKEPETETANKETEPETQIEADKEEDVSSTPEYYKYKNARFGYVINYPDFLIPQEESQNGDGRIFVSADGRIKLMTWGSFFPRTSEELGTIDGFYNYVLSGLEYEPTYTAKKSTYFVFSGYKGDNIVYEKYFLKSDKTECAFRIEYPATLRDELYDAVTHIANTMTVEAGYDSTAEK